MAANAMSKVLSSVLPAQLTKRRLSEESGSGSGDSHSLLDRLTHKKLKRDEAQDDRLSAIEEHGVIGNMRTCALVSVSAEIDWFCYPNFDSPSIFAAILDRKKGGYWSITTYIEEDEDADTADSSRAKDDERKAERSTSAAGHNNRPTPQRHRSPPKSADASSAQRELLRRYVTHKQLYHSDTNVLVSRFLSDNGVGQVMDYMPAGRVMEKAKHWLVRELQVVRGRMTFQVELVPAFNYARDEHSVQIEEFGCRFISSRLVMELRTTRRLDWELTEDGKGVTCLLELSEEEKEVFIFCESERCPAGHWQTAPEDDHQLFVSTQHEKGKVRHDWNEGRADDEQREQERKAQDEQRPQQPSPPPAGSPSQQDSSGSADSKEQQASHADTAPARLEPTSSDGAVASTAKKFAQIVWRSTGSLPQAHNNPPPQRKQSSRAEGAGSRSTAGEAKSGEQHKQADGRKPEGGKKDRKKASPAEERKQEMAAEMHGDEGAAQEAGACDEDMKEWAKEEAGLTSEDDAEQEEHSGSEDAEGDGSQAESTIRAVSAAVAERLKTQTIDYWRDWIGKCTYNGRWREVVYRSALVLKLMTFEPTGAIVAALTTSLPEEVRGERNWDYRFTWIRDSSFTLYAFLKLGFKEEAAAFMQWISQRCEESSKQDGSLQIMYGLHGEHKLEEKHLSHLEGYKLSQPVRIGNGAYEQVQLDIYGELMDTVYLSNKYAEPISYDFWRHVRKMVDWICAHWREKDEGVWETRAGKQSFVYSKVMSWVAVDRGVRLAEKRSFPCELAKWRQVRDDIYEEVQEKGWNEKMRAYTQSYGSDVLDASVLIMPLVFFAAPTDPRFISTLEQILRSTADGGLVSNNLVFRYNSERSADGLKGQEGTFSICTFWAVEAAARLGVYRKEFLEKSRYMFEQMLGYANHLGLYSEEIGKRGEHLGNFPQAFTHLALISAAVNLDKALSHHVPGTVANINI